ncbi:hypothetical protein VNI00_006870 [Paramarasmius palmivorus]|uniref:Glutaminase A n=1 Tax=Paramarasmius palmivorus TaxID=297713 RepID=A0AAW0D962_9AGAR
MPMHWDGDWLGWTGFVRVDGTTWRWMGESQYGNVTTLQSAEITPTRTNFAFLAGPVQLNASFLSPIEPSDWVLQSLPFSYLSVNVQSLDGQAHDIQLYSDITAHWVSGDVDATVQWETTTAGLSVYHQARLQNPRPMSETKNMGDDSTLYYAMARSPALTWQTGMDGDLRKKFLTDGRLSNTQETKFRAISSNRPTFALSVELGRVQTSASSSIWSIGLVRDPVINYNSPSGPQLHSPYFRTRFEDIRDAIDFFIKDYPNALQRAEELDRKILADASVISTEYVDLVSLTARQAMAGLDITVPRASDSSWNASAVKAFMRDEGFSSRVNPVDTIFSALPMYAYLNASLVGLLLDPLLEYQDSSSRNNSFASPDLGNTVDNRNLGLESTSSMLILALAHAQYSGDGSLIARHYGMLKNWTEYLVTGSLHPKNQISVDQISTDDMSNLAIKGIIGIGAMAEISRSLERGQDFERYSGIVTDLTSQWVTLASSGDRIASVYGDSLSWGLIYNLYADILLQTKVIPEKVYNTLTSWYDAMADSAPRFGLPYDSRSAGDVKSSWTFFAAATATTETVRDKLIKMVHSRADFNEATGPFPLRYKADTGASSANYGQASPAQGALFALLAQNLPLQPIELGASKQNGTQSTSKRAGVIAGSVIGSLILVALIVAGLILWRRRNQRWLHQEATPYSVHPDLGVTQPPANLITNAYRDSPKGSVASSTTSTAESRPHRNSRKVATQSDISTSTLHHPSTSLTGPRQEITYIRREISNLREQVNVLRQSRNGEEVSPPAYHS